MPPGGSEYPGYPYNMTLPTLLLVQADSEYARIHQTESVVPFNFAQINWVRSGMYIFNVPHDMGGQVKDGAYELNLRKGIKKIKQECKGSSGFQSTKPRGTYEIGGYVQV